MTDDRSRDEQEPENHDQSIQTGVLDTGGTGLYHGTQHITEGPDIGESPVDVSEADPFDQADQASAAGDLGEGTNTTGKQFEYEGVGELIDDQS